MGIHIGSLIEARIKALGMTKAEFGRRINTTRQNVNTILRKHSLDAELLQRISLVLKYDFFKYYSITTDEEVATKEPEIERPTIKIVVELPQDAQDQLWEYILKSDQLHQLIMS